MPWLTILVTLLSFFASKKSGNSSAKSAAIAGLAGAATYYTTHETTWGRKNLGELDGILGVPVVPATATTPATTNLSTGLTTTSGNDPKVASGVLSTVSSLGKNTSDVLTSWGATGTSAVIGTTALANSDLLKNPLVLGGLALGAVILLTK